MEIGKLTILELQEKVEREVVHPFSFSISGYSSGAGGLLDIMHDRDCVYSAPFQTIPEAYERIFCKVNGYKVGAEPIIPLIQLSPRGYIDAFCSAMKIKKDVLLQKSRKRVYVQARQTITTLIYINLHGKYSLSEIGQEVLKDHATVLHSVKVVTDLLSYNKRFKVYYDDCAKRLSNQLGVNIKSIAA